MSDPFATIDSNSYSDGLELEPKGYSYSRFAPSEIQTHCLNKLCALDPAWDRVTDGGVITLNRKFGIQATTSALQSLLDQARLDGLTVRNPFALLWAATEERHG